MAFLNIQISKPANVSKASPFLPSTVNPKPCRPRLKIIGHFKSHITKTVAYPNFIVFKIWKYLFVGNCILIANDNKFLSIFH